MEEPIKKIITLSLATEPGGSERTYAFYWQNVVYAKSGYYRSVKKTLCKICFAPGCGLPEIAYSTFSIDDLQEIFSSSPIVKVHYPKGYIRIPLRKNRNEKFEEQNLDISTVYGIQVFRSSDNHTNLILHIKGNDNSDTVLYAKVSVDEWEMAIKHSASTIN
jgi:hypothetical protein